MRDFEKAVSMISYGFDAIEDFYSTSSTQGLVDKVKIPLLFVQVTFLFFVGLCEKCQFSESASVNWFTCKCVAY